MASLTQGLVRLPLLALGLASLLAAGFGLFEDSMPGCGSIFGRYSAPYFAGLVALIAAGVLLIVIALVADRHRKLAQSILMMVVSGLVTVVVIDLVWTVSQRDGESLRSISDLIYESHPSVGHWLKPNFQFQSGEHQVVTDEMGIIIRTLEGNLPAPPGTRRVMMLGDSLLEGYQIPSEQNLSIHADQDLNAPPAGQGYHVLNLGKGGFSPIKYLLVYRHFAPDYEPHIVLTFLYFTNDVQDDARIQAAARIVYDDSGDILRLIPEVDLEAREVWTPWGGLIELDVREDQNRPFRSFRFIRKRLVPRVCEYLDKWGDEKAAAQQNGASKPERIFPPQVPIREAPYAIFKQVYSEQDLADIQLSLSYLEKLNREVLDSGAVMLLVIVPDKVQVNAFQPGVTEVVDTPRPQDIFIDFANDRDISYLDLLPGLQAQAEDVIFLSDSHFSAVGHRIVGQLVAEAIMKLESGPE